MLLDAPSAVSNQAVKGGKAAYFFIPPPVRLSMSKAIQVCQSSSLILIRKICILAETVPRPSSINPYST